MRPIRIPEDEFPTLKGITELDPEVFDSFLATLKRATPALRPEEFAQGIKEGFQRPELLLPILGTLCALYRLKDAEGITSDEVANAVSSAAADALTGKQEILRERLKLMLECDASLGVTAKALDVMTEHEHVFCSARILSDIRPVFAATAESASAAVVVHNLQLGFYDGGTGKHREIYIALDSSDLQELKQVIVRSEKKNIALKSILKESNIPFLEA